MKKPDFSRFNLGRLSVDRVTLSEALERISLLVRNRRGAMVFTPNVDHVVLASENAEFQRAYAAADLSLADGMPVVWASHLAGLPVPEKVSGSDLVEPLMRLCAAQGFRVYLFGGADGVAEKAARALKRTHQRLCIVGAAGPMIDLRKPTSSRAEALAAIQRAAPHVVLVGLGAPKQELWMFESRAALAPAVLLGVGASLDFLAGTAKRAPKWVSACGLEWLYRLGHEPKRLWRRYLVQDPKFLGILVRTLIARRSRSRTAEALPR